MHGLRELNDAALMARVATGDRAAQGELVHRHQAAVLRYTRALCRDEAQAEDALQQTFLDALKGARTWSGQASLRGWLLTLARNAVYRGARRRVGEPTSFVPLEELGLRAGWGADPAARTAQAHDRARLLRALDRLAPASREVLVLRELEGFTGPETAARLGIGLAATKSRLHRARLELAAALRAHPEVTHGP